MAVPLEKNVLTDVLRFLSNLSTYPQVLNNSTG